MPVRMRQLDRCIDQLLREFARSRLCRAARKELTELTEHSALPGAIDAVNLPSAFLADDGAAFIPEAGRPMPSSRKGGRPVRVP
jgi:hypothetical protein